MSENRRQHAPRAAETLSEGQPTETFPTLAERLAGDAGVFVQLVKVPSGDSEVRVPIVCSPQYNGENGALLSSYYVLKAASAAASVVDEKKSDEENMAALTVHMNGGYKLPANDDWDHSLLETAVDRAIFEHAMNKDKPTERVYDGDYNTNENSGKEARKFRAGAVKQVMTDPVLADKYEPWVREARATILAERFPVKKRTKKDAKPTKNFVL